jgi:hypothetical protein
LVTPEAATVAALSGLQLVPSGGTGAYQFALIDDQSGASVHPTTGAYISGPTSGGIDRVELTDEACSGRAWADIQVTQAMDVAPRRSEMRPGTSFALEITGGSGNHACELLEETSGGSVAAPCTYTAGPSAGLDILRVRDLGTGEVLDAKMTVDPDAEFRIAGGNLIFIPDGSHFTPAPVGGSGHLDLQVLSGSITIDNGALVGTSQGPGEVRITDRFTGTEWIAPVRVVRPYTPTVPRDGERSGEGVVHTSGDLNGDGYADGVMGFIELSVGAHYSGAVIVYQGGPNGLLSQPVQVFGGTTRSETVGRDLELEDVNGDGEIDLLIGADRSDQGSINSGGVFIHHGVQGGFFEPDASRVLRGEGSSDRFGHNLVACDFDADGFMDLAVGAIEAEDRNVAIPAERQGAIHVFRGTSSGFGDRADFVIFGELPPPGGAYRGVSDMQLGTAVRAGDLDGDGLCDLVVGAPEAARSGTRNDGAVVIFQGTTDNNLLLTRSPVRLYAAPIASDGNFGNDVEVGDLDGDGVDDLIIAHYRSDMNASAGGAVYVFLGGNINDHPDDEPIFPSEADWVFSGRSSFDYTGQDLSLTDLDGDAQADLLIGQSRGENGSPINAGKILGFTGAEIAAAIASDPGHDATDDTPTFEGVGTVSQGRLGQAVGGVGRGGILALAGYDDTFGTEAGAGYFLSTSSPSPELLDFPGEPAGHEFGQGLTLFDYDQDGDHDLIIGGPGAAEGNLGGNSGMVFKYERGGGMFVTPPDPITNGHVEHDGSDRYGYAISTAGDFDGDGNEDLAILARGDERPSSFDDDFVNPNECPGSRSLAGATWIYMGDAGGLHADPSFVAYGFGSSEYTRVLRGGFDLNDDGYDDLLIGSYGWSSLDGGFAILYGQPRDPNGITVLCDPETYIGVEAFGRLGASAAVLGDMDGDGCDDVAVGAPRENFGVVDQGSVRVLWGYGGPGCPATPEVTTLVLTLPYSEVGSAMDGGKDVDGDGISDLLVGGANFRIDFSYPGGAWIVPGSYLLGLPRQSASPGSLPSHASTVLSTLLPELGDLGRYGLVGPVAASHFGEAVALVPDPEAPGRAAVAVGAPIGNFGGTFGGGGVVIHRWVEDALGGLPGLDAVPWGMLGGESVRPLGSLGAVLEAHDIDGVPTLLVGAPISSLNGLDVGAGYVLPLTTQ